MQRARVAARPLTSRREDWLWFGGVSFAALLGGIWLLYGAQIYVGDALARAANAQNIILSRDPHLAAIGFIWPPLPSLLEVPLIAALHPFGQAWFAPQILTAASTGLLAFLLNRVLALLGLGTGWRIIMTVVVLLNPIMAYSAINGLTENMFLVCALAATYYLLRWTGSGTQSIALAGIAIGLGFLIRYEAIAFAGGAMLTLFVLGRDRPPLRHRGFVEFFDAHITALLAPIAFLVALWLLWNFLFEGDALFFFRGLGSNAFYTFTGGIRSANATTEIARAFGSLPRTAVFAVRRLLTVFAPALPAMLLGAFLAVRRRDRRLGALVLLTASLPAFETLEVYQGQLFEWVRFWSSLVPFAALLIAGIAPHIQRRGRPWFLAAALMLMIGGSVLTARTMAGTVSSPDEREFVEALRHPTQPVSDTLRVARAAARVLDALPPDSNGRKLIAIDAYVHVPLVLLVRNPHELVIAPDRDFRLRLQSPLTSLDYVLLPEPTEIAAATDLNRAFLGAYEHGASYLQLETAFPALLEHGGARLYRIVPPP